MRRGDRAIKEEVGDAHGSWVEEGVLTHSPALAPSRAAPHGVQPSHNPPKPQNRARSRRGGRGKQAKEALRCSSSPAPVRALLPAPENAAPFRASPPGGKLPSSTTEVFCIRRGASPAALTQPPETPRGVSASPSSPPPQASTGPSAGLRPTQDLGVPLPDSESAARPPPSSCNQSPQTTHTHTHTHLRLQPPGPVEAGARTWAGGAPGIARGRRGPLPEGTSAPSPTRSGSFSLR